MYGILAEKYQLKSKQNITLLPQQETTYWAEHKKTKPIITRIPNVGFLT
jgi:hypothetical protein